MSCRVKLKALYELWDALDNPEALPIRIQNPAKELDHVKREIAAIRFFEIPAGAIEPCNSQGKL